MQKKTFFLAALIALSVVGALYEGVLYWYNMESSESLLLTWQIFFIVLLVLWVDADSKTRPDVYRPYEYGYLVFLYWIPYLPFYLWRTRGAFGGALMLGGFILLWFLGYLVQWLLHVAR